MSGKRGMSAADKRTNLEAFFHAHKTFFTEREVEKMASKERKIPMPAVKDVLADLVSDGLVQKDKIGISNYFWSFPSEAAKVRLTRLSALERDLEQLEARSLELETQVAQAESGRLDSALIQVVLETKRLEGLKAELDALAETDPRQMRERVERIDATKARANKWIDSIYLLEAEFVKLGLGTAAEFRETFCRGESIEELE